MLAFGICCWWGSQGNKPKSCSLDRFKQVERSKKVHSSYFFFLLSNIRCRTGESRILFSLSGTARPQNACSFKKQFVKPIVMDWKFQKVPGKIRENPLKMYMIRFMIVHGRFVLVCKMFVKVYVFLFVYLFVCF